MVELLPPRRRRTPVGMIFVAAAALLLCHRIRCRGARSEILASPTNASTEDRVDHGDVADYDGDEGLAASPAAGLGGAVGPVLGLLVAGMALGLWERVGVR